MDGGNAFSNNFTIYLMLIICVILVTVDSIEIYKICSSWNLIDKIEPLIFDRCFKKELILKTVFGSFSFLAAISAFVLTLCISLSVDYFIDKILTSYLYLNYFIFGPYMLGFSIYGLYNWNDVVYMCDKHNFMIKIFSISNMFSLIGCFILSLIVTVAAAVYEVVLLYIDSILRRDNGSKILRNIFWWVVLRTRGPNFLQQRNENENNQQDINNHSNLQVNENNQNNNSNNNS